MSPPAKRAAMATTISIDEELADELYERKSRGESYADVIRQLIQQADGGETAPEGDVGATGREPDHAPAPTPDATRDDGPDPAADDNLEATIDAVADEVLPGSGAKAEERAAAFRAVVEFLQERGTATPTGFKSEVYPDHRARYTDGEDPARSWWKNAMYPALSELSERRDELARADHSGEWRWRGGADAE